MMMTRFRLQIFSLILFSVAFTVSGQDNGLIYLGDASTFMRTAPSGSARILGMGGVGTSLGADIGTISSNPAGLGLYKKSEFSFSPGFNFANSTGTYLGNKQKDFRTNFNVSNIGIVFANPKDELVEGDWRGGAFGISFTRINNYQNQYSFKGTNNDNSMADYFAELAQGIPQDSLFDSPPQDGVVDYFDPALNLPGLAYWAFLINPSGKGPTDWAPSFTGKGVVQSQTVLDKGARYEWNIAYGGNINDKIYLGGGVGVPTIRSITERTYKEIISFNTPSTNPYGITEFRFSESIQTKGTGINFKFGTIVKATDNIRIGVSLISPTWFTLKNDFVSSAKTNFTTSTQQHAREERVKTYPGTFKYNITMPARLKGGISYFLDKHGFISGDIEYVPYNTAQLNTTRRDTDTDRDYFEPDNVAIKNLLRSTVNINVGGEYRKDMYRLRAGFAMMGDPFVQKGLLDKTYGNNLNMSIGAGIRLPDYYFDVAVINSRYNTSYTPYTLNNGGHSSAAITSKNTNFTFSFGAFF